VRSGQQDIESDLKHLPVGSWQHIFIYRYPNTELAKTLIERHSVPFGRSSKSDLTWGIGIGCIYNTASLGRNFISEKASNGQSKTPKLNSKTNGSEAIVKSKSGTTDTNISLATSLVG